MKKIFLLFALFSCSMSSFSMDISGSTGVGFQYGGIFGGAVNLSNEDHRIRAGLGYLGYSVGYDYRFYKNNSLGLTYNDMVFYGTVSSLSYRYLFNGTYRDGWELGLDVGEIKITEEDFPGVIVKIFDNDAEFEETEKIWMISVGYNF